MKEEMRRAIISIAAKKITGSAPSSIYSFGNAKFTNMTENYDFDAHAHFSETYHFGLGSHITITISGNEFNGYDFGENHHFSGKIDGTTVTIYDSGLSSHFHYSL